MEKPHSILKANSAEEMARTYSCLTISAELNPTSGKYFSDKNKIANASACLMNKRNIAAVMNLSLSYGPYKTISR